MSRLTITDRRERALVRSADALLAFATLLRSGRARSTSPRRIVCLRLERIGDLVMTVPAIADLKAAFPDASIDLVVGSWNREIAAAIPGVDRVETLDASWLSRPSTGSGRPEPVEGRDGDGRGVVGLMREAARWRSRRYDLAINFEADIRGNLVMAAVGAAWTAGFVSGGGGALLDTALEYDTANHTTDNARALARAVAGAAGSTDPTCDDGRDPACGETTSVAGRVCQPRTTLTIPQANRDEAARLLSTFNGARPIGIHVSAGRAIKQWPETRFRDVAERLVRDRNAAIVLTGAEGDRGHVDVVRAALPASRVLDLTRGVSLLTVAAVLERIDLLVTGDTGPMHLASAVGTPIVAVFGPSDPNRYAPRGLRDRVVRVDLPCSPCNRIRLPPARCTGHTPDCLTGVDVSAVLAAIDEVLAEVTR
jgi:ADP-heptose:LPS heptosyltransferase